MKNSRKCDDRSFVKEKNVTANKTDELFGISHHPHFENKFILTEKATGGILKTGTREEIIVFCSEKLASSADIAELEEMIDNSDTDDEHEFEAEM